MKEYTVRVVNGVIISNYQYKESKIFISRHIPSLEEALINSGFIPVVFTNGQLRELDLKSVNYCMIDISDAVLILPDYRESERAIAEYEYACVADKVILFLEEEETC